MNKQSFGVRVHSTFRHAHKSPMHSYLQVGLAFTQSEMTNHAPENTFHRCDSFINTSGFNGMNQINKYFTALRPLTSKQRG